MASRIEELRDISNHIDKVCDLRRKLKAEHQKLMEEYLKWDSAEYWEEEYERIKDFCSQYFDGVDNSIFTYCSEYYICLGNSELFLSLKPHLILKDSKGNTIDSTIKFSRIDYQIPNNDLYLFNNIEGNECEYCIDCDEFLRQVSGPKSAVIEK